MKSLLYVFLLFVALPLASVVGQVPSDPTIDPPIVIIDPPVIDPPTDGGDAWIDTDSDGMTDEWELANGLDPEDPSDADLDADGDGLTNVQEFEFGSDPNVTDTDGGGASDYDEWVLSTAIQDALDALDALAVLIYQAPGSTGGTGGFIGSGNMEMSIVHRPIFPIDPIVTDPESEDGDVTDPELGEEESTDPGQSDLDTIIGALGIAAAPNADEGSDEDVSIDDPITDPVVDIDPTKVLDALSELLGNFDPNDDADDEAVVAAVAKLKELKLWQTVQDIASNKIDLAALLWSSIGTPPIVYSMGSSGGPMLDKAGLDGSTSTDNGAAATPLDPLPPNMPKATNFGGGGGGGAADVPSNAGGNNSAPLAGAASSGGSGGGGGSSAGASASGGHGVPHSALVTSAPAVHSVMSISGSAGSRVVAAGSKTTDAADEHHHHHHDDFGGGSSSGISGSSSSHVSATVIASTTNPATSGGSSTTTGFAVMSVLSAAGWALRRFLTAAI